MTRRRIIAGVILLAAVVVAVPLVPGVWERVAYREHMTLSPNAWTNIGDETEPDWSVEPHWTFLRKRRSWLPGDSSILPDQKCPRCQRDGHESCWRGPDSRTHFEQLELEDTPWATFRCTCTDPSHDGDSE